MNKIHNANCLDILPNIADGSIDMINTDLPYGTTACKWDSVIPFNKHLYDSKGKAIYLNEYLLQCFKDGKNYADSLAYFNENCKLGLWDHYKRVIKPNGVIALTGSQPFTTDLINSNKAMFKYTLIWHKTRKQGFAQAPYRFMTEHEDIVIFGHGGCSKNANNRMKYNPQGLIYNPRIVRGLRGNSSEHRKNRKDQEDFVSLYSNYPCSVLKFKSAFDTFHDTQKPVELYEYLIKTYTNEGDLVLDTCAGSFTTAVACLNTKRNYICIEQDPTYFASGSQRIANVLKENSEKLFL